MKSNRTLKTIIGLLIILCLIELVIIIVPQRRSTNTYETADYVTNNDPGIPHYELTEKVLKYGDTTAYWLLSISYLDKEIYEQLPYSLVMANRYNDPQAYFDVYYIFLGLGREFCGPTESPWLTLDSLDATTQKLAIQYLLKAAEYGHGQAKEIIELYKQQKKYLDLLNIDRRD